jgi:predicted RNA-binding protein with PUA-like domain
MMVKLLKDEPASSLANYAHTVRDWIGTQNWNNYKFIGPVHMGDMVALYHQTGAWIYSKK